jgi:hypothetical protein
MEKRIFAADSAKTKNMSLLIDERTNQKAKNAACSYAAFYII